MLYGQRQTGFTIVELLIVVVVIAILAAITIVAYNGIQQRALTSTLQSELSQAVKKLETVRALSGTETYPADLTTAGIPASNTGTLTYFYSAIDNSYCIQLIKGTITYTSSSLIKNPAIGSCIESGLIGWWTLNGNANDTSGNAYHGTASSTTDVVGQDAQSNHAYGFAGASSNVNVASNTDLSSNIQTFSFWVYPTSWTTPTASVFLSKRPAAASGWLIGYLNASTSLIFDCGGSGQRWTPGYTPPLNQWTNLIFTCSSANGVALYVNGALNGSRASVDRSAISSSTVMKMGQNAFDSTLTMNGRLDDVRLFSREFNATEAQSLFTAGAK
ncbi:MAG: LamG domain-containing protein [Candidatus Microsaccharimonas sp.]